MQFCTNLEIPGVPAGGLESVWRQMAAGTWDNNSQPFPQITVGSFDYPARGPSVGPGRVFYVAGPQQVEITATNSSSL